jgi:hypothetical protein
MDFNLCLRQQWLFLVDWELSHTLYWELSHTLLYWEPLFSHTLFLFADPSREIAVLRT